MTSLLDQYVGLYTRACKNGGGGGTGSQGAGPAETISTLAILYTVASVTIPSLASVYNEFALKKNFDTSVHLQNFFLYFYGAVFNLIGLICVVVVRGGEGLSVFHGHNTLTMLLVANNAAQGVLSSFFYKFADTILKKYSSTVATIFTGLMSAVLFGHALSINFCIGVTIVLISMHLFFTSQPDGKAKGGKRGRAGFTVSPSMEHIVDKEGKMLREDELLDASIDERAMGLGGDRAMLLPR